MIAMFFLSAMNGTELNTLEMNTVLYGVPLSTSSRNSFAISSTFSLWIYPPNVTKYGSKAAQCTPAFRRVRVLFSFPAPKSTTLLP